MKLIQAAKYFDDDVVFDGYTGQRLFKAQFSSYDGSQPDGSFERRRTVSVAAGVAPAARRVVRVDQGRWVMGELVLDTYKGKGIRQTCSAKQANVKLMLLSPGSTAARSYGGGVELYGFSRYLKDTVNTPSDSEYDTMYEVSFASNESLPKGCFLKSADQVLYIRGSQASPEGFIVTSCDEVYSTKNSSELFEVDAVFAGEVDPVTEVASGGATVPGLLLNMYKLYHYQTQADKMNKPGDMSLLVDGMISVKSGQVLMINADKWVVMGYYKFLDAWNLHIRRA